MRKLVVLALLFLTIHADSTCTKPQSFYQLSNGSIFMGLQDIERALDEVYNDPLDEIEVKTGTGLLKNTYTIKSIKVNYKYKPDAQVETLGTNSLTKKGGMLQLTTNFEYQWREVGTLSTKEGKCQGFARFTADFEIVDVKVPTFSSNTGKLTFKVTLTDIVLPGMVFQKLSGEDPTATAKNMIDSLMNSEPSTTLSPLRWQLQERLRGMTPKIQDFTNQIPDSKFSAFHPYSWGGKRVDFDYTLNQYTLAATGETLLLKALPIDTQTSCYDLASFGSTKTHYAVSKSIIENSFNSLKNNMKLTQVFINDSWKIANFFFRVKDLSWIIPNLTDNFKYEDPIGGQCVLNKADAPQYNKITSTFDTVMTYDCVIEGPSNAEIMEFTVDADYQFAINFNADYVALFQVATAVYGVTSYQVVAPYTLTRDALVSYYVSQAAESMIGSNVFGSEMLSLPSYFKQPAWKMSDDGTTLFFYDAE